MHSTEELKRISSQVRRDIIRMTNSAKCGHPGGALGCADFLTALYFREMEHKTEFSMEGKNEDVFFLSNGHLSAVWYSVLARAGYFDPSELGSFRKLNSRLQGHPATEEGLPGIRMASGSLGQGMSVALGAALSKKMNGDKHLVYSLHGDGEMQEGQNWEAMLFGAHNKVDNIICTIDYNNIQIDGHTTDVMSLGDLAEKFKTFGWETLEMNGNDMQEVVDTLALAKLKTGKGKPVAIIMKTVMSYPVDFMMDKPKWHGVAPNDEERELALSQLEETIGDY